MRRFEYLRERLLIAGIAPRHVRRYVRELCDHFDDLEADARAAGANAAEAQARARCRLGDDDALLAAMTRQRGFRSLSARAPWMVFALAPLLFMMIAMAAAVLLLAGVGGLFVGPDAVLSGSVPAFRDFSAGFITCVNHLIGPLAAVFFLTLAVRQRSAPLWPMIGLLVILLCCGISLTLDIRADDQTRHGIFTINAGCSLWPLSSQMLLTLLAALLPLSMWRRPDNA